MTATKRKRANAFAQLEKLRGILKGAPAFKRDKTDRIVYFPKETKYAQKKAAKQRLKPGSAHSS